jgi:hypothetical protein
MYIEQATKTIYREKNEPLNLAIQHQNSLAMVLRVEELKRWRG